MADNLQATPRNQLLGLLSDAMYGGLDWMKDPQRTQQMQGLAGLLESTGIPKTTERMAYGEPLTNIGRANVPLLKPETADALMNVAPLAPVAGRLASRAIRATEGMPVGMSIKDVSKRYPQQDALNLAQQRAALPVEQGGLGLPANNTAADRAKAMGFDMNENLYHGTEGDFLAFQKSPKFNTYATEDPEIADIYAMSERRTNNAGPNVIPLVARGKKLKVSDYDESNPDNYSGGWFPNNVAARLGIPWQKNLTKRLPEYGYDRLEVTDMADLGGIQTQHMFPDPDVLRSRFAAFDPFRKDVATATAMGVALPDLLAAEPTPEELQRRQSSSLLFP